MTLLNFFLQFVFPYQSCVLVFSGYGYVEYADADSAAEAVASLHLFELAGKQLRVRKAITPPSALAFLVHMTSAAAANKPLHWRKVPLHSTAQEVMIIII